MGNISMKNEPVKTEFLSMAKPGNHVEEKFMYKYRASQKAYSPNKIDLPSHLVDGYVIA